MEQSKTGWVPRVSIVVPTCNAAKYLPACLDTLLLRQGSDVEVVVVDDCSSDGTADILRRYALKYDHLQVVTHPVNKGVSAARNTALDRVRGEYILFVDADDRLHDGAVDELLEAVHETKPDIVSFQHRKVDEHGLVLSESRASERYYDLCSEPEWLLAFGCVTGGLLAWNGCYKRELLQEIRFQHFCNGEDALFALQAFCRSSSLLVSPLVLYDYLKRENSASGAVTTRRVKSVAGVACEMVRVVQVSGHYESAKGMLFRKVRAMTEGPLIEILVQLDKESRRACWVFWFDQLKGIYCDTDMVPASRRWIYRMVFMSRSRGLAILLLYFPMCIKKKLMAAPWFSRKWSMFRFLQLRRSVRGLRPIGSVSNETVKKGCRK